MRSIFTKTETTPRSNPLILRLFIPAISALGRSIGQATSEETKNQIEEARTNRDGEKQIEEMIQSLRKTFQGSLDQLHQEISSMIPQQPNTANAEDWRQYHDQIHRFNYFLFEVEGFLKRFQAFFAEHLNRIIEFYTQLWKDVQNGDKNAKDKAEQFNARLQKEYYKALEKFGYIKF